MYPAPRPYLFSLSSEKRFSHGYMCTSLRLVMHTGFREFLQNLSKDPLKFLYIRSAELRLRRDDIWKI